RVFNFTVEPSSKSEPPSQRNNDNYGGGDGQYNQAQLPPPPPPRTDYSDMSYLSHAKKGEIGRVLPTEQPPRIKPEAVACPHTEDAPPRVVMTVQELVNLASMEL